MSGKSTRIVIVGATSAIAEQCARLWIARGPVQMALVGRHALRLERLADDLRLRNPDARVQVVMQGDALDPQAIDAVVASLFRDAMVDIALIAHGMLPDQQRCESDLAACEHALQINGVSPALYLEAMVGHMRRAGHGTVAVIGSVAGDRGRKSNYVYGAAKGLLARYAEGLQHRLALSSSKVKVVLIKPGPTDTPMTAHLKAHGAKLAPSSEVASAIVAAIDQQRATAYVPARWRLIMQVIRHLPRSVFSRLDI